MKGYTKKFLTIIILSLVAFVLTSDVCSAQGYSRGGKSEIFGLIQMVGGTDITFDMYGITDVGFELDSTNLYGFGIGWNVTDHWNINTDLLFGSADGDFVISGIKVPGLSVDADYFLWDINVDYNIFADRLTPLVTAGIGLANIDVSLSASGYGNLVSASETDFSYNVGAGGRWDITDNILIKLVYRVTWTQLKDAEQKQDFSGVALSVAYMF